MIRFGRRKPNQVPTRRTASKPSASRRTPPRDPAPTPEPEPEPELSAERKLEAEPMLEAEPSFAGDEERFFNEPETSDAQLTTVVRQEPQLSSIAPTVTDSSLPNEPEGSAARVDTAFEHRRRRLRSTVLIAWCASAALLLFGLTRRPALGVRPPANATPARVAAATPPAPATRPEIPPSPPPAPSASAPGPRAVDDHTGQESARALVRSARSLLEAGKIRAGVSVARQALALNSSDAEPYILLAAGLQDLGDWSGAQRVFAECQGKARHGSHADCSYFLSQKH